MVMAIGTLAIFRWQLDRTDSERAAQTVALTTMVFYQMLQHPLTEAGTATFTKDFEKRRAAAA